MYMPAQFEETSMDVLQGLIKAHPLATVVTHAEAGLNANHIPLILGLDANGQHVLQGHVARANPMLADIALNADTLVVFQGEEHYITPSWYATKAETGKVVPTWNYAVVHVRGLVRVVDDAQWLQQQLANLTDQQEQQFSKPWAVSDAPAEFVQQISKAIVGIEIQIHSMQGKWKVSQNQPEKNRASVIEGLGQVGTDSALAMREWVKRYS